MCFPLKTSQRLRITGDNVGKELQGHETMQASVLDFINHAHATTTKSFEDAVVGNALADQRWNLSHSTRILGCVRKASQRRAI